VRLPYSVSLMVVILRLLVKKSFDLGGIKEVHPHCASKKT
jgi:hypothetical protein